MNEELKKDMKVICDVIHSVSQKHGDLYISASHIQGQTSKHELLAECTVRIKNEDDFLGVTKFKDEYFIHEKGDCKREKV